MFGFPHFGYFGRFSDKLSPLRRSIRSPFRRPLISRTPAFTCERTGEVISPLDCRECQHYTLIEGEEDLRTCHYRSPEQLEVEQENRRKTEAEIRRNEEINRELEEEWVRLEDRRRSIEEEFGNREQGEKVIEIEDEKKQFDLQIEGYDNESKRQEEKSEKQEEAWEEAFREPEEETEGVDDEGGDDTLHNSDGYN
jgi:hypothetical protein